MFYMMGMFNMEIMNLVIGIEDIIMCIVMVRGMIS